VSPICQKLSLSYFLPPGLSPMRTHRSFGHADLLRPDVEGLVVGGVDRGPELVLRQPVVDREQLPRELDRVALEVVAEAEVAQHLEERVVARGIAHFSRSLCLPPARTQRCAVTARWYGRFSWPRNTSLNWFMPALVKSSVGSLPGTSELEATGWWPFEAK
jgi:hypothetical protein